MRIVLFVLALASLPVPSRAEEAKAEAKNEPSIIKVVKSSIEKGEVTLVIDWGKDAPKLEGKDATVVFLFQAKNEPVLKLDAALLGNLKDNWEVGILSNKCTWVLRSTVGGKKTGEVLQIISGDGKEKDPPDFRTKGEYPLQFRLNYTLNRSLPTDNVQVALFQQTDPNKWQQSSTNFRLLSNVAELSKK